jgi:hypothetical protein
MEQAQDGQQVEEVAVLDESNFRVSNEEIKKLLKASEKTFLKTELPLNLALKKIAKIQETMPIVRP